MTAGHGGGTGVPNVFDLLDAEWRRLRNDRAATRRLREVGHVAGDARNLAAVEEYVRAASPENADGVLLALVSRGCVSGGDDPVAARVLLQLLLPGTRNLARRWWALGEPDERAAAAVAAVYDRIRNYPLARRPGRVAANVLMDAARQLRRAIPPAALTLSADPILDQALHGGTDPSDQDATPNPALELAELLSEAVAAQVIDAADAELIARSRIAGQRVADIARHRGAGARTLWDRRNRAEKVLRTRNPRTWHHGTHEAHDTAV
jgi:hypothetical protein